MPEEKWQEVAFCPICDKETQHLFVSAGHERDSSGDYEECFECHSYRYGFSNKWIEPYKE